MKCDETGKLRFGILSTSSVAPRFIGGLDACGGGTVQAIASRTIEKASEFAAKYNIPKAYGSYEELVSDPDIDVVYVAMVNSLHYTWVKQSLLAGKNVICEKPFTLDAKEAAELFDLAAEKGLFLVEAQKSVFLPVMNEIRKLI